MSTSSTDSDCAIVQHIAIVYRQALSELYIRYQRSLFNYLLQLTPDYGLAEELLQDTLVAIWKSAGSFEGRSTVRTWLIGIGRRQAYNTLRQLKLPCVDESELEELAATEPEPEELALASVARDDPAVHCLVESGLPRFFSRTFLLPQTGCTRYFSSQPHFDLRSISG